MEKLKLLLSPAGTAMAPGGADVYGLLGSPVSHHVTGGEVGAPAPALPDGLITPVPALPRRIGGARAGVPGRLNPEADVSSEQHQWNADDK